MRGRSDAHLVKTDHGETRAEGGSQYRYDFWCGDAGDAKYEWNRPARDENSRNCCRTCNAAFFKAKLAAEPTGFRISGANLTGDQKEALGQKWRWRHMWPVSDAEGHEWGWIAMEGGWGERWQFVTWSPYAPDDTDKLTGKIGGPITNGRGDSKTFSSKEAVLFQMPALIAEHHLRDKATRIAETVESRAQAETDRAQREIEQTERDRKRVEREREEAVERAALLDGLRSIRDTFGAALSNLERAGLLAAIAKWEK